MALVIDPKHIGSKVKVAEHGRVIEVCEANAALLLNLGQTQFFKYKKDKDASNNKRSDKPVVHKRKRKSNSSES